MEREQLESRLQSERSSVMFATMSSCKLSVPKPFERYGIAGSRVWGNEVIPVDHIIALQFLT